MRVGEYEVVVENASGHVVMRETRTATTGHPLPGDEVVIEGRCFVVRRIRHYEEPEARCTRRYTTVEIIVRERSSRRSVVRRVSRQTEPLPAVIPLHRR
jgi:hypothetical protein